MNEHHFIISACLIAELVEKSISTFSFSCLSYPHKPAQTKFIIHTYVIEM